MLWIFRRLLLVLLRFWRFLKEGASEGLHASEVDYGAPLSEQLTTSLRVTSF